ncbi:MAG: sodium:proton antiporter [Geminicoccus sp.]|nr:sodium:proton antiporter [Geminicoccus sp.]
MLDQVRDVLNRIKSPEGQGLVESGYIQGLTEDRGLIRLVLEAPADRANALAPLKAAVEDALKALPGVSGTQIITTTQTTSKPAPEPAAEAPERRKPADAKLPRPAKHVLGVASGKGGVGKSTTAYNLAVALARDGLKVGILDADIYGPSVPLLSGLGSDAKPDLDDKKRMIPLKAHGLELMSIGFLVPQDSATVWRGPMVQNALFQLYGSTLWGGGAGLDVLVVDLPPGTGDIQLSLAQQSALDSAIIVTTPQDLSMIDALKGVSMLEKVGTRILGVVENMSGFLCSNCGIVHQIFGAGAAQKLKDLKNIDFLGAIPLTLEVREGADSGNPVMQNTVETETQKAYLHLKDGILSRI